MKTIWYFIFKFAVPMYLVSGLVGLCVGYVVYVGNMHLNDYFGEPSKNVLIIYLFTFLCLIGATYATVVQFIIFRRVQKAQKEISSEL